MQETDSDAMAANVVGVDFHYTDSGSDRDSGGLPPTVHEGEREELFKWFHTHPALETTIHIRILCVRMHREEGSIDPLKGFDPPLPGEILEHAMWRPDVYRTLAGNPSGGAAGMLDEPFRFILQTPLDGGPFCSLAMSRRGFIVKGVFFHDDSIFDPVNMPRSETSLSGWRSSGEQIVTLPHEILKAHSANVSQRLAKIVAQVKGAETALAAADRTPPDLSAVARTLHTCSADLVDLERRSRFEESIMEAIRTILKPSRRVTVPWPPLAPQETAVTSRSFDFESLPRRIDNARATISNLIQQRNEQLNLELTQASFRIAEATLSDSKSMKTIAILTMLLLPGTAVASLFSMNLFNWSAEDGSQIATKWLWIYCESA